MENRFKQKKYKELIGLIAERLEEQDKNFLLKNSTNISKKLVKLSNQIIEFNQIILNPFLGYNDKILAIKNMNFTTKQAKELYKTITSVNLTGGANGEKNASNSDENIPQVLINYTLGIPKKFLDLTGNLLINLANRIKVPKLKFEEYRVSIDLVYILLFMFASLPVIGLIPNLIIIIKGAMDGKYFLSMMTIYTTFLSILYAHAFDIGGIIKLLYAIDTYSYSKYSKKSKNKFLEIENKSSEKPETDKAKTKDLVENKTGGESIYKGLYRNI